MVVDDHDMVREGLRKMIEEQTDLTLVCESTNGKEAIELAKQNNPDVIIMDVNLPLLNGIEITKKISEKMMGFKIIGLSLYNRDKLKKDMKNAGAVAYLTKDENFETLVSIIRKEVLG